MDSWLKNAVAWTLGPETAAGKSAGHLWPRWIFLRALGLIYFSVFYSLLFQIRGLIGPGGILPAGDYLQAVAAAVHGYKLWYAPSLFWLGSSDRALMIVTWAGLIASALIVFNVWPRASLLVAWVCFLSFIATSRDFSSYQSDGMLLEAGFIALFFAPPGLRPGLGRAHAPSRASLFLLQWEGFRIYFESGIAKMASHDPTWRNFTAMDDYYQNAPLPTWIGWYVGHLPYWFHASAVFYTLAIELVLCFLIFLPRRFRIALFIIVLPFQTSIILTGNYAFLNYIVFCLGFLFLDDRFIEWVAPQRVRALIDRERLPGPAVAGRPESAWTPLRQIFGPVRWTIAGICLGFVLYVTAAKLVWMLVPDAPLPQRPVEVLEPFRIANQFGLFAVMTHQRYEIEFQGSTDGKTWTPYEFRYKPQALDKAPGIYAPYQPRFEWNLWFASLGAWPEYRFVVWTEERLLTGSPDVRELFRGNPFPNAEPQEVRAVIYQYWFTDMKTKRETGMWWRRDLLGDYAPALERAPDGKIVVLDTPTVEQLPQ
ncbi:MAG TPA: lipase maturation factor family protein [Candidatus Aquilonibacter sp.]|nr:lipase maturation factor family protein [Candidatus Aquilonibacter sp.]